MAVPVNTAEDRTIYIVDISMGSGFQGHGEDLDEYRREITYKFGKDKRNRIGAVRQTVNVAVQGTCMKFYKTRFTNANGKATLEAACTSADREMKAIDTHLHVTPMFYEVKVSSLSAGNMFDEMKNQLSVQVHQKVLSRIKAVLDNNKREDGTYKPVTGKTRTALLSMLEKVEEINILNDPDVTARLTEMREQIQQNSLIPLRDEILAYIEEVQNADTLEITPDITPDEISTVTAEQAAQVEEKPRHKPTEINIEDLL
jgi:hypothetical protein